MAGSPDGSCTWITRSCPPRRYAVDRHFCPCKPCISSGVSCCYSTSTACGSSLVSSTQAAVDSASQNAFWNEKRQITPGEIQAIQATAPIKQGIATLGTRRNVPNLSLTGSGGRLKTRKSKKGGQIVTMFFNIRDQVKMYHWQTKSFSEHKATDELVGTLDTNIDKFVEVYMGRYGRPLIKKTLPVKNLTVTGIRTFITRSTNWLTTKLPRMLKKTDSDLLNIRDEILGDLNQVKYLFTLV